MSRWETLHFLSLLPLSSLFWSNVCRSRTPCSRALGPLKQKSRNLQRIIVNLEVRLKEPIGDWCTHGMGVIRIQGNQDIQILGYNKPKKSWLFCKIKNNFRKKRAVYALWHFPAESQVLPSSSAFGAMFGSCVLASPEGKRHR